MTTDRTPTVGATGGLPTPVDVHADGGSAGRVDDGMPAEHRLVADRG